MNDNFLRESSQAAPYHLPHDRQAAIARQAEAAGLRLLSADLSASQTIADALAELGRVCDFPDWYGANFDALLDCLTDPDGSVATGLVLLISGLDALRKAAPDDLGTLLEVLATACDERRGSASPLWVLLDTLARGIEPLPDA